LLVSADKESFGMNTPRQGDELAALATLVPGLDGFTYADLFDPAALARLHQVFVQDLERAAPEVAERYRALILAADPTRSDESWAISTVGPFVEAFVARLFGVQAALKALEERAASFELLFVLRRDFVKRRAQKKHKDSVPENVAELDAVAAKLAHRFGEPQPNEHLELAFARMLQKLLAWEAEAPQGANATWALQVRELAQVLQVSEDVAVATAIDKLERFAAHRAHHRGAFADWAVLTVQHNVDYADLVPIVRNDPALPNLFEGPSDTRRERPGFDLTDRRRSPAQVAAEVDTCIYCHERKLDSCSLGLHDKEGTTKKNPLGISLDGCPLDEHISEAHQLQQSGRSLAALAAIMVNNPMCPGTGHRICNDCMKACIYQKQEPVNIPEIETGVLTAVLDMPYGPEIYGLLTRWNPLNLRRPYQLPCNGKKILVVGLGPAGYTLAHYLTSEGFGVVAIDGLKIEPHSPELVGPKQRAVKDWKSFCQPLDERVLSGFGGVSEYGITVRWDKNFLRLLHLTLERKRHLALFGGVRFGGTFTLEDAQAQGFEHVAIATGAGKPTIVDMKNNLVRGVRQASDFLMALQLTGAAKESSLANLQVELPGIVVGGGLTAIDTATELMAYYPVQVERVLTRSELLASEGRLEAFLRALNPEERATFELFVAHGQEVRAERAAAQKEARPARLSELVRRWGGVKVAYRKSLQDSPAYRLNHEEVIKALEEGVEFLENVSPTETVTDSTGRIRAVKLAAPQGIIEAPCHALMIAAGTSPNTIYERENPGTFAMEGKYFKPFRARRADGAVVVEQGQATESFFTSYTRNGLSVSYYGDNHPVWNGNVVKAMASARAGFPHVRALFTAAELHPDPASQAARDQEFLETCKTLRAALCPEVVRVDRLTSTIVEVVLKAPMAAQHFQPGQFFRLQDFEVDARLERGIKLGMEGIALTGAWVDKERGLLSLIVLEMGGSSSLVRSLKPGQRVVCMGPTGTPTTIPKNEKVVLCGGGLGNAVLFSIARALKDNGCQVLYFAGYKNGSDLFKRDEVEAGTDQVIWSTDTGAEVRPRRAQDHHFRGNIVESMLSYARGSFGQGVFPLSEATRFIVIGSDRMMAAVAAARKDAQRLAPHVGEHVAIGSINSPMQCMMKEVCAQCLQRHVDPVSGKESFVFSCFDQDQCLDKVDWSHLNLRLRQNGVLEKLSAGVIALLADEGLKV
jgi:NADPH-dependent glutamate synthase beta subunit-like oxidoreductase/NAD(P)H-flavin reductase